MLFIQIIFIFDLSNIFQEFLNAARLDAWLKEDYFSS